MKMEPGARITDRLGRRQSLLLLLIFLCFGFSRFLILRFPDGRQSTTTDIFAVYGFEAVAAATGAASVYDIHRTNVRHRTSDAAQPRPGSGTIEYPPLAISWMALPARAVGRSEGSGGVPSQAQRLRFAEVSQLELATLDFCVLCILPWVLRKQLRAELRRVLLGMATYAIGGAFLFVLIYDRMDLVVGLLLLGALAALLGAWPVIWSYALLAIAINFKLVALLVAPVCAIGSLKCGVFRRAPRDQLFAFASRALVIASLTFVLFLPYWLRDGWQSLAFLRYHADRGLQGESLPANILFLLRPFGLPSRLEWEYGAVDVIAPGSHLMVTVATVALLTAEFFAIWRIWRLLARASVVYDDNIRVAHAFPALVARYWVLALIIGLCGAKVFSPQYLLWLLPLAPLAVLRDQRADRRLQATVMLACFAAMLTFPLLYLEVVPRITLPSGAHQFFPPTTLGLCALTLKNLLVLRLAIALWRHDSSGEEPVVQFRQERKLAVP